jgi:hypothetical protein
VTAPLPPVHPAALAATAAAPGGRPCPRCEADALGPLTPERIEALAAELPSPPSMRVTDEAYHRRLNRCGTCASLREGVLCAHCGCFVQIRAAMRGAYCPSPSGDQWA